MTSCRGTIYRALVASTTALTSRAKRGIRVGGPGTAYSREAIVQDHSTPKNTEGARVPVLGTWVLGIDSLLLRTVHCEQCVMAGRPGHGRRSRGNCSRSLNSQETRRVPRVPVLGTWVLGIDSLLLRTVHASNAFWLVVRARPAVAKQLF